MQSVHSSWVIARRELSSQSPRGLSTYTVTRTALSMFSKSISRITLLTLRQQNNLGICRPPLDQLVNLRPAQLRHRRRQSLPWQHQHFYLPIGSPPTKTKEPRRWNPASHAISKKS